MPDTMPLSPATVLFARALNFLLIPQARRRAPEAAQALGIEGTLLRRLRIFPTACEVRRFASTRARAVQHCGGGCGDLWRALIPRFVMPRESGAPSKRRCLLDRPLSRTMTRES